MGMHVHSLGELPVQAERAYYVYLLDYGWEQEGSGFTSEMFAMFPRMADVASRNSAAVIQGCIAHHFADEVLSWHHINGRDSKDLLPAILVTTRHPKWFRHSRGNQESLLERLLIVPLKKACRNPDDVRPLLRSIFTDIEAQRPLRDFEVSEIMQAGIHGAKRDALILQHAPGGKGASSDLLRSFFEVPDVTSLQPDILLVTVNAIENKAVLDAFREATGQDAHASTIDGRVYRDLGTVGGARVFHAISQPGSGTPGGSQVTVDKAIRALDPGAIIAIGIAFGVDQSHAIGDILLSTQLSCYEQQRVGSQVRPRGDRVSASPRLVSYFRSAQSSWSDGNQVRPGLLLTGEKLIDDLEYRNELRALEPEAIGGEMEGGGLLVACQEHRKDWVVLKAISDWADGNKGKNKEARQRKAAQKAVSFLIYALKHASFPRPAEAREARSTLRA